MKYGNLKWIGLLAIITCLGVRLTAPSRAEGIWIRGPIFMPSAQMDKNDLSPYKSEIESGIEYTYSSAIYRLNPEFTYYTVKRAGKDVFGKHFETLVSGHSDQISFTRPFLANYPSVGLLSVKAPIPKEMMGTDDAEKVIGKTYRIPGDTAVYTITDFSPHYYDDRTKDPSNSSTQKADCIERAKAAFKQANISELVGRITKRKLVNFKLIDLSNVTDKEIVPALETFGASAFLGTPLGLQVTLTFDQKGCHYLSPDELKIAAGRGTGTENHVGEVPVTAREPAVSENKSESIRVITTEGPRVSNGSAEAVGASTGQ